MSKTVPINALGGWHLEVCICTYRRPQLLRRLLEGLRQQDTDGVFTFSVLVIDNDAAGSGRAPTAELAAACAPKVRYFLEPRQNIALARNKAIEEATGDFIVFIDDDEFPPRRWLLTLLRTCIDYDADGVLGPVKPHFDQKPPRWLIQGKFYERASYPTGFVIDWRKGRTGNTLLRRRIFTGSEQAFNPDFLTGEDQDFFRRMIARGHVFVWCHEAAVHEVVPPVRWSRKFMLKRAMLSGKVSCLQPDFGLRDIGRSVIAVPIYFALLPLALIFGQRWFMTYLVKLFDHLGTLLTLLHLDPIKDPYITE